MKVSVIIPVYNNADLTKECLASIFSVGAKYDFEVIVVDNASSDHTDKVLAEFSDQVSIIKNKENLGFAKACNQGAKKASGQFVIFLNNDTIVTRGWLDELVFVAENNAQVGVVGAKLLYPDETIQHAGVVFAVNFLPYHVYKKELKDSRFVNREKEYQAVTGACLLIEKEFFQKLKGFDEIYQNGLEDVDLCLKVRKNGRKVIYCPKSVVYHYESMTEGRGGGVAHNERVFLQKWQKKIEVDDRKQLLKDGYFDDKPTLATALEVRDGRIFFLEKKIDLMENSFFWRVRNFYLKSKSLFRFR